MVAQLKTYHPLKYTGLSRSADILKNRTVILFVVTSDIRTNSCSVIDWYIFILPTLVATKPFMRRLLLNRRAVILKL